MRGGVSHSNADRVGKKEESPAFHPPLLRGKIITLPVKEKDLKEETVIEAESTVRDKITKGF